MGECRYCIHYRRKQVLTAHRITWQWVELCSLGRRLEPCEQFEREVGADDDKEGASQ